MVSESGIRGFMDTAYPAKITVLESAGSTNDEAKKLASLGAPEGTAVIAREQTAGRGRNGRTFYSGRDLGLYMSVIIRPDCLPGETAMIPIYAGGIAALAIERESGLPVEIKWTNDILVKKRKIAGILCENAPSVGYAVVGIGVNLIHLEEDFPPELREIAASVAMLGGHADPNGMAAALLSGFSALFGTGIRERGDELFDLYRCRLYTLGKRVLADGREGRAVTLRRDGGLEVEFDGGLREVLSFGDVSVRGLYGNAGE